MRRKTAAQRCGEVTQRQRCEVCGEVFLAASACDAPSFVCSRYAYTSRTIRGFVDAKRLKVLRGGCPTKKSSGVRAALVRCCLWRCLC